ncbi:hypothetical protein DKX38_006244 [Salix brachista]|uniref:Mitochondrial import receptor subunit TOM6 homolog n=1 Tax=Salix brachista TaxID=2182728 RepID=A0A5N5N1R1_9ROSI|nr:hypothetical protein DKX38_006244 [Salix brachista]
MFPGMFMRKPDKAEALKQLKSHVAMFGAWVVVLRVTPYVLHYLSNEKDELKLDLEMRGCLEFINVELRANVSIEQRRETSSLGLVLEAYGDEWVK